MQICKFCKTKGTKAQVKKREVTLPIGLLVTSLDLMCAKCYNKLKQSYDNTNNLSGQSNFREVERTSESTPTTEGR